MSEQIIKSQGDQSQDPATVSGECLAAQGDGVAGLAGKELDAAVAERVMGFQWVRLNKNDAVAYLSLQQPRYLVRDGDERLFDTANPYSTNIAAAMEVVEKMYAKDWSIEMARSIVIDDDWLAVFTAIRDREVVKHEACAKTLPVAICRAALEAVATTHQHAEGGTADQGGS